MATKTGLNLEFVNCCVCESRDATIIGKGEDFEYHTSPDTFSAMQCNSCRLVYLNPRPTINEFEKIYPPTYHAYNKRLGATIERKTTRHLLGRVFFTFANMIIKLPAYDTQCGAKLFRSELLFLFEEKFITKWLFDIEILGRYRNKYGIKAALDNIIEVPVNSWMEVGGSKFEFVHMLKAPFELYSIHSK